MTEPLRPLPGEAPASVEPDPGAPTLLDLSVDPSWGAPRNEPMLATEPVVEPAQPQQPAARRFGLGFLRRWLERRSLSRSVEELATEETVGVDLTPDAPWKTLVKTSAAFLASAALAYLVLTFPSQLAKASYAYRHLGQANEPAKIVQGDQTSGSFRTVVVPTLSFRTPADTTPPARSTESAPAANESTELTRLADNQLYIPKLQLRAPIIWDSSFEEKIMLENLQKGVTHYGGTDLPNATTGNVFITGHSSYYWWDKGQYKTIFALLPNLTNGDQVALTYQDTVYVYEVFELLTVKPSQVDVLETTPTPILSLMTCVPIGTSLNRLIVRSKLVGVFSQDDSGSAAPAAPAPTTDESTVPTPPAATSGPAVTPATPPSEPATPLELWELIPGLNGR